MNKTQVNPLAKLSDSELIKRLEALTQKERKTTLEILLHLIEVDRRSLYLPRGYSSLFEYCVRHLRYSESAANRRVQTARCIRDFPEVQAMLEKNEVNLYTVSRIAGILTDENKKELLVEIRNQSVRRVDMIVARYRPDRVYRDRVRPVYIKKRLLAKENNTQAGLAHGSSAKTHQTNSEKQAALSSSRSIAPNNWVKFTFGAEGNKVDTAVNEVDTSGDAAKNKNAQEFLEKRFKLEFTVPPHVMKKLDQTRAILSTKYPRGLELGQLLEIVLDEYIDRHSPYHKIKRREKRVARKEARVETRMKTPEKDEVLQAEYNEGKQITKEKLNTKGKSCANKKQQTKGKQQTKEKPHTTKNQHNKKKPSRFISAAVRDEVFKRDKGLCTFVSSNGIRCNSNWNLQIDHIVPHAKGGDNSASNLRLLCAKHNRLEAERIYGKAYIHRFYHKQSEGIIRDQRE